MTTIKTIKIFIKNNFFIISANLLILLVSIINRLPSDYIVARGDGYQFFNSSFIEHFSSTWDDLAGQGAPLALFTNYPYYIFTDAVRSVLHLPSNYQVSLNYIIILMGAFWSFYLALGLFFKVKDKQNIMTLLSLVYTFNLYTLHIFLDEWGCSPFFLMYPLIPIIFGLTYRIFSDNNSNTKLFLLLGIVFAVENIVNSNLSFFIAICLMLTLLIILISFFNKRLDLKRVLAYGLTILLTTIWSTLPQFFVLLRQSYSYINGQSVFNINEWVIWQSSKFPDIFFFIFDYSNSYLNKLPLTVAGICLFVLFIIAIINIKNRAFNLLFLILVIFNIFLINKGKGILPNEITSFIFRNPILASLRSFEKTAIFLPFLILVVIAGYLINQKNKNSVRLTVAFLAMFSLVAVYPFFTGNVLEKYSISFSKGQDYLSAKYSPIVQIPKDYFKMAEKLNYSSMDVKILRAPYNVINSVGWVNFPKWKLVGTDPTVQLFNNSTVQMNVVGYFGLWNYGSVWNNQSIEKSRWILPLSGPLNSRYLIYHKDIDEKFIKQTKDKVESYENRNDIRKVNDNDFFALYRIDDKYFLPHFYSPTKIASINKVESLPDILSKPDYDIRSVIFVKDQNERNMDRISVLTDLPKNSPTLESKKINPAKYRVIVHGAKGIFPIVFSESFNDGWEAYVLKSGDRGKNFKEKLADQVNSNYKILEGNDEDQATDEEITSFINQGFITTLGNVKEKEKKHTTWKNNRNVLDHVEKYDIDFVSKNFHGTIQNDNLDSGNFLETWFKAPIQNDNHLIANGYANSWLIETSDICEEQGRCIKNSDGSYDFEMVVEYRPQRMFIVGLSISVVTLLLCISFLIFWRKKNDIG